MIEFKNRYFQAVVVDFGILFVGSDRRRVGSSLRVPFNLGGSILGVPGNSFLRSFLPLSFIVPHAALLQLASAGHPGNEFWSTTGCALENFIFAARADNIPRRRQVGPLRANIFYLGAIFSCTHSKSEPNSIARRPFKNC